MAQVVEHLASGGPLFKPQYHQRTKKKEKEVSPEEAKAFVARNSPNFKAKQPFKATG
jgi:hypothetical protein